VVAKAVARKSVWWWQPVVHEYYEEIVFTEPTVEFYEMLQKLPSTSFRRIDVRMA
jgi:hypothetical protein